MRRSPGSTEIIIRRSDHILTCAIVSRREKSGAGDLIGRHVIISPCLKCRSSFRSQKRFVTPHLLGGCPVRMAVIVADQVLLVSSQKCILRIYLIDGNGYRPGLIQAKHCLFELNKRIVPGAVYRAGVHPGPIVITPDSHRLLRNFIAYAPHHNRWVIPVPQDLILQVPGVPFIPVKVIVIRIFWPFPHVKCLIHHNKTHTIA